MAPSRRYLLLCPIARALDRVGDRWTLLILRDLHAGPARFSDLKAGLMGMATNLLTDRLGQLVADGLVAKRSADFGIKLYELTELGERSDELLFELAKFGGLFLPDAGVRPPGNLRTIAVTLKVACRRVVDPDTELVAELSIDGECFTLAAQKGDVRVKSGSPNSPDVTLTTEYEPMVAAGDGRMDMQQFVTQHVQLVTNVPGKDAVLVDLLGNAVKILSVSD